MKVLALLILLVCLGCERPVPPAEFQLPHHRCYYLDSEGGFVICEPIDKIAYGECFPWPLNLECPHCGKSLQWLERGLILGITVADPGTKEMRTYICKACGWHVTVQKLHE